MKVAIIFVCVNNLEVSERSFYHFFIFRTIGNSVQLSLLNGHFLTSEDERRSPPPRRPTNFLSPPSPRQSGALFLLLSRAEAFSWHLLDAATYQRVLGWYIMSCDPASVLETEAREPVDVALMG